jgi:hypothetical protein
VLSTDIVQSIVVDEDSVLAGIWASHLHWLSTPWTHTSTETWIQVSLLRDDGQSCCRLLHLLVPPWGGTTHAIESLSREKQGG